MKLDYDRAWREATGLMRDNRALLTAMAGIFFFLPYAVLLVTLPRIATLPTPSPDADFSAMMAAMTEFYGQVWWAILLIGLVVTAGTLSMLALLKLRAKPTVGQAIGGGLTATLPYLVAIVLQSLATGIATGLISLITAATGVPLIALAGLILALAVQFYILVKFSLTAPVMAIGGVHNPLNAMKASWQMTKGNSRRLLGFYALLFLAFTVTALVVSMLTGVLLALGSESIQSLGSAIVSAGLISAALVLFVCVLAAIYTQLGRAAAATPARD
ncbi:glycerophosphoryl diester phosphodiesterase membrane domain-containing protein [Qipengyuania marisflavi]|uniref:Glycerophosphoryl diester phosphodiesterase membrane domain-containing protein n=1 Tax=Qipengyuania marisflavi TaxID=2486356 RepID=A0A5S3P2Z4_9SPHN|nr:glycerophosphoryl diester phosphodiesterase membrane domain-containing protein [Qipengyuania marisflavi]TMM47354.1 hypothetical protein FEV51_09845 [Qipengyuania marisflavi]